MTASDPVLTLREVWARMGAAPSAIFLVGPNARVSYGELSAFVSRLVAAFAGSGLAPGDRVMILARNETTASGAFLACLLDGLVPVILTPETPAERAAGIARSVEPRLAIVDRARCGEAWLDGRVVLDAAPVARAGLLSRFTRPAGERAFGLDLPREGASPRLPEATDELGYILFTSGTTQAPSGVMVNRGNLLANLSTMSRLFGYDCDSRIFNDMVLAHADGLIQGPVIAAANGCTVVRSGGFSVPGVEAWLNRVRSERATHVITVPTVWTMIDRYAAHDDYFDAAECRGLLSVAARLDVRLWRRLEDRFRRPVFNQYGLTETVASALYAGPHPEMGAVGTIGRPVDCEARIGPASGRGPDGGTGELQLSGTNVFAGYWRDAERTAAAFTADGWMRTGDLARALPDGSYEILGRIKSVIMSGGFLIRPEEIDEAMTAHPAVIEAATVALPDPDFEEIAVTAVVLAQPCQEADLTAHARAKLEGLKVPKRIIALPEIPRGDAGKPRLQVLRAMLGERLAREAGVSRIAPDDRTIEAVVALAAEIFRVDPATLGSVSSIDTVPGWDSFSQINLVMATETRFGISIPAARIAGMRTLGDLAEVVARARG